VIYLELKYNQHQTQVQKQILSQKQQLGINYLSGSVSDVTELLNQEYEENPFLEIKLPSINRVEIVGDVFNQEITSSISLEEYLERQITEQYRDTVLRRLMLRFINYLDDQGYLRISNEVEFCLAEKVSEVQFLDALTLFQQLDPAGIGARNLQESLLLQCERDNHSPSVAYYVLESAFRELSNQKWQAVADKCQISLVEVQEVRDYLKLLTANVAKAFQISERVGVIPEMRISVNGNELDVKALKGNVPQLSIDESYLKELSELKNSDTKAYLKQKTQLIHQLSDAIERRVRTVEKITRIIADVQKDYFLGKTDRLKPMSQHELAQQLEVNDSTISRAVNDKYIDTPQGVFELKHFFVAATLADETTTDVLAREILAIINQENKLKPLSDSKIQEKLAEKGMTVARRTVVKYRQKLNIESSTKRKRLS
jgi:RNA polymerase sigma-54 factor